jgi:hypothetical protein
LPKLILYIESVSDFSQSPAATFGCRVEDEVRFAGYVGAPVIIANTGSTRDQGYVALGMLSGFRSAGSGAEAIVTDLLAFPYPLGFLEGFPPEPGLAVLSYAVFDRIIRLSQGYAAEEAPALFNAFGSLTFEFTRQLEQQRRKRCSFSDVKTYRGVAQPIRPVEHGGSFDISNFLFLDPEPGALFGNFAWTVGPQFQIIVDAQAAGADVASTVNRTGMLALGDDVSRWPDRSALDWHFEEFCRRRRTA